MAFPCPDDCPDGVPYLEWIAFSQLYQEYLTYCALATAAANSPGPGPFQPLGVYTHTTDSTFVVPADASLVYWNVPGQSGQADIDFSLVQAGQEVTIVVIDSNGFNVTDVGATVFSLNDTSHRIQGIKSNGDGTITRITGTAAQYDVGTSGATLPLNNANITRSGTLTQNGATIIGAGGLTVTGVSLFMALTTIRNTTGGLTLDITNNVDANASFMISAPGAGDKVAFFSPTTNTRLALGQNSTELLSFNVGATVTLGRQASSTPFEALAMGRATMVAGTVTVNDDGIAADSVILVTPNFAPTGTLYADVANIVPGVSFDIDSTNAGDAGDVSWTRYAV